MPIIFEHQNSIQRHRRNEWGGGMITRKTMFSNDRKYRYTLWRDWSGIGEDCLFDSGHGNAGKFVQFVGLNPSTADETQDDPTMRRCIGFAKSWGYGAMCMTNLFAFRATDPEVMKKEADPVGWENNHWLVTVGKQADIIIAAWGKDGMHRLEGPVVLKILLFLRLKVYHLGLNSDGTPKHPLHLKKTTQPIQFAQ